MASPANGLLEKKANSWLGQLRRQTVLEACASLAGWTVSVLFLLLWVDSVFLFSRNMRLGLFVLGLGAFFFAVRSLLWRALRAADIFAALEGAVRLHPELKHHLKPAWELRGLGDAGHTSPDLARAHGQDTERLLRGLPEVPVFRWIPSTRARRGGVAALLCLLTLPWGQRLSWGRILAPWRDVPLERFISITPGDARVDWGKPAQILARWDRSTGGPHEAAQLKLWVLSRSGWRQTPWTMAGADTAGFSVASLSEPLRYRLGWRDLRSREYSLVPVPAPQLDSLRARLAGRPPVALSAAEALQARRGDWVVVSGKPNLPLARALLRVSFLPVPPRFKTTAAGELEAGFLASEDGSFQLDLETSDGRRDPSPLSYALKARMNEPPRIELLSPAAPIQVSPDDTVPVAYSASDDAGLRRLSLLLRIGGRETEIALQRFEKSSPEFLGDYPWDLSGLPPGTQAEFRLKAVDDDRLPLTGFSKSGRIEIVDFEAGHEALERRWDAAEETMGALAAREERVAQALEGKDASAVEQALSGLPEAWKQGAGEMGELAKSMAEDPYANPGVSEQVQAMSEELSQAASAQVPRVSAAHRRRAETARKMQRILKQGRGLQDLQDFHNQVGRMSRRGSELETALDAMKGLKKGEASSGDIERLQRELRKLQKQMESLQQAIASLPKPPPASAEEESRKGYELPLLQAQTAADALAQALKSGDYGMAAQIARELSQHLSRIEKGLGQAAAEAAGSSRGSQVSRRMQQTGALWNEVIEEQRRLLEASQRVEERRMGEVVEKQKRLLAELAREQALLVSSAVAAGSSFPGDVLGQMRGVQAELERGRVVQAPALLRSIIARRFSWLAEREQSILDRLEGAPQRAPADPSDAETRELSGKQESLRSKTGGLQGELEKIEEQGALLPGGAVENIEQARGEQQAASQALGRGDSQEAQQRQQNALDLLEQGGAQMGQSQQTQTSIESGMGRPFQRPAGGARPAAAAGRSGVNTGFVPLPSAKDYLPPRELREELERSQRESRPEAYDAVIKEYFKRLAK
jgi:hypothetical protein